MGALTSAGLAVVLSSAGLAVALGLQGAYLVAVTLLVREIAPHETAVNGCRLRAITSAL